MNQYELRERQERSSQHHVRWLKALYASLAIGAVFLFLPRAVPWFSSGVPETAMGRPLAVINGLEMGPFILTAGLHMLLAVCYGYILAMLIYRFEVKVALLVGIGVGVALYGLNYLLFRLVLGISTASETPVLVTHLFFSAFFSTTYKALSIPDADRVT